MLNARFGGYKGSEKLLPSNAIADRFYAKA
jgi:hypothetical protein